MADNSRSMPLPEASTTSAPSPRHSCYRQLAQVAKLSKLHIEPGSEREAALLRDINLVLGAAHVVQVCGWHAQPPVFTVHLHLRARRFNQHQSCPVLLAHLQTEASQPYQPPASSSPSKYWMAGPTPNDLTPHLALHRALDGGQSIESLRADEAHLDVPEPERVLVTAAPRHGHGYFEVPKVINAVDGGSAEE